MSLRYWSLIEDSTKRSIDTAILSLVLSFISSLSFADEGSAYDHIYEVMDRYHQSFDVYTDLSAAGNHFVTLGRMTSFGDDDKVAIDPGSMVSPHSGRTCIENRFIADSYNWGRWSSFS